MKIKAVKLKDHPPVRIITPYGSSTSVVELTHYIRQLEAELAGRAWARKQHSKQGKP